MASDTGGHQTYYVPEQSKYPFLATIGLGMAIVGAGVMPGDEVMRKKLEAQDYLMQRMKSAR